MWHPCKRVCRLLDRHCFPLVMVCCHTFTPSLMSATAVTYIHAFLCVTFLFRYSHSLGQLRFPYSRFQLVCLVHFFKERIAFIVATRMPFSVGAIQATFHFAPRNISSVRVTPTLLSPSKTSAGVVRKYFAICQVVAP